MNLSRAPRLFAALLALISPPSEAQEGAAAADARLDFVVRDKKGLPVRDLQAADVEILEAGVKRSLTSLRLVEPGSDAPSRYLSLVLDGLDAEGQKSARKAALEFVTKAAAPGVQMAVFRIGLELWTVQGFTNDSAAVRAAIEKAASPEDQSLEPVSAAARTLAARELGVPETAAPAQAVMEVQRIGDEMQKIRQDQSALYPLIAVAKGQAGLPGRKTVVYFCPGLNVPSRLDDVFRSLVSEANRAGVSLYAIDARGLRNAGDLEAAKSAMQDVNRAGLQEAQNNVGQQRGVGDFRAGERVSEGIKQGETNALKELAESTGAEYLLNINDLRKATDRILSDASSYYEARYAPSSDVFDGQFRSTEVKVARPGVKVAGRSGYFALPPQAGGQTLLAYEIPMMAALAANPPPHDLDLRAGVLLFGEVRDAREVMLLAEMPLSGFKFAVDETAKLYKLRFALLAQVRNAQGDVVYKVSQSYPFEGPLDKLEALKRGNVVFRRSVPVPPGQYAFEAVVQDRETKATTVSQSAFDIPAAGPLRVGSVLVIRRVEPVPADRANVSDPLRVDALRIVPNLGAPISKGSSETLSLFMPVYPSADGGPVSMTLELAKGGALVAQAPVELPARDKDGRIPYVGSFALSAFAPGTYDVKVTVRQGSATVVERSSFAIVP